MAVDFDADQYASVKNNIELILFTIAAGARFRTSVTATSTEGAVP